MLHSTVYSYAMKIIAQGVWLRWWYSMRRMLLHVCTECFYVLCLCKVANISHFMRNIALVYWCIKVVFSALIIAWKRLVFRNWWLCACTLPSSVLLLLLQCHHEFLNLGNWWIERCAWWENDGISHLIAHIIAQLGPQTLWWGSIDYGDHSLP